MEQEREDGAIQDSQSIIRARKNFYLKSQSVRILQFFFFLLLLESSETFHLKRETFFLFVERIFTSNFFARCAKSQTALASLSCIQHVEQQQQQDCCLLLSELARKADEASSSGHKDEKKEQ